LRAQAIELEAVVAIGYATVQKRDVTGAVASVSGDAVTTKAAPTPTVNAGLQGRAAGVQVVTNSGMPGIGASVRIRGTNSLTANSEPLYVVDGVPAEQGVGGTSSSAQDPRNNPLMSIDPNEIESIDVLKDASAKAIYGARGANGVVDRKSTRLNSSHRTISYAVFRLKKKSHSLERNAQAELGDAGRAQSKDSGAGADAHVGLVFVGGAVDGTRRDGEIRIDNVRRKVE